MAVVPRIGTEFAGYRIEALLGRGGMSVVYRAENARLGNKVALKLLADVLADDESFRERFVRESRTAATLNHPNVVTIYDAGDEDGVLYIAMRYVESDLKQYLARDGPLPASKALGVVSQIASALDAAHARGLLHRDVKPANILLDLASEPGGVPHAYLADFGLTKHLESRSGITASGQFVGTIDYMSPEQIEGREVDGRSDIYSLGCVLFECLAGTTPYRRETDVAVLWAHMREDPPPVTELRPELPGAVDLVIARAVDKDPAKRYPSARELVGELQSVLEGASGAPTRGEQAAAREPPPTAVAAAARPPATRRKMRFGLVAAIVAALAVGALAGTAAYEAIRDVEPQIIAARGTTLSDEERVLLKYIPLPIRRAGNCRPTEPPNPDFDASVVCRPGDGIIKVQYSRAEAGSRLQGFFRRRVKGEQEGRTVFASSSVNCTNPPASREWRAAARTAGHRPGEGDDRPQGRFICYEPSGWAAIEWTDSRMEIYAIAFGRSVRRVFRWWETAAGPVPRD